MRYKRFFAVIWVVLLLLTATGCDADFMEDPAETSSDFDIADTSRTGFVTSKESFVEVISDRVDLSLYEEPEKIVDDLHTDYTYHLKEENHTVFVTDYSITLHDGTTFVLNHPFSEMEDQGWTIPDPDKELAPGAMSWFTAKSDHGKQLNIGIYNNSGETLTTRECAVFQVKFNMFSKSDHHKSVSVTPGFTVCKTISHTSGLDDILNQLGAPEVIHYSSDTDPSTAEIELIYNNYGNDYDWIEFYLSADGNYILDMVFSYIPHD